MLSSPVAAWARADRADIKNSARATPLFKRFICLQRLRRSSKVRPDSVGGQLFENIKKLPLTQ
jgi:hypothetical protein